MRTDTSRLAREIGLIHGVGEWFLEHGRDLPWRRAGGGNGGAKRDPYHALVAEVMAQQTQISRVVEYFARFIARFPTLEALAAAREGDVLAAWSGLGYYRRARLLQAAAREMVATHEGRVPCEVEVLRRLPGLGRYTAGAIASIVYGQPAAIVDGNVRRVLMRIEGHEVPENSRDRGDEWAWARAEALVGLCARAGVAPGVWNEGLMELGATVCTPASPTCEGCPIAGHCVARARGLVDRIPAPKARAKQALVQAAAIVVRRGRGAPSRVLMEQRPPSGLWASMWQVVTLERLGGRGWKGAEIAQELGLARAPEQCGRFEHVTSHRVVRFGVWKMEVEAGSRSAWVEAAQRSRRSVRWKRVDEIGGLAISSAQRRVLEIAGLKAGVDAGSAWRPAE